MAATPPPSGTELVAAASDLAPLLADEAAEAERNRQPSDRVIAALRESGLVSLLVPPPGRHRR